MRFYIEEEKENPLKETILHREEKKGNEYTCQDLKKNRSHSKIN